MHSVLLANLSFYDDLLLIGKVSEFYVIYKYIVKLISSLNGRLVEEMMQ